MTLLANWIEQAAVATPDAVAWLQSGETITYAQLAQRAAAELETARQMVALADASSFNLALAACAASYRGLPFLPLNPALPTARRAALLAQCGWGNDPAAAQSILRDREAAPPTGPLQGGGRAGSMGALRFTHPPSCGEETSRDSIELLIATSGSSGEPKAVMLSGDNLAASVAASQQCLPVQAGDVWLDCLPLYHIGGMMIVYRCAAAGATVLLHQGFAVERVWADIQSGQVGFISLTPPMLSRLLDFAHGASPSSGLKYVLVGGAALVPQLAQRARSAGWPLCLSYGMSETASQLATDCDATQGVGIPLPGFTVSCNGTVSQPGVIRVRGAALMAGYANPALTPGDGLEDGWFATGDLGWLDKTGRLHVAGRRDDILVSGASNVHPADVEVILAGFPGVTDVAVTALPDPVWGDRLVALVVGELDLAALESWSRSHLSGALRPRVWRRVTALPRNALGKLLRDELRKIAQETSKT